jgi:hypothetical protein
MPTAGKEDETMINSYEPFDLADAGEASSLIQDKETMNLDEVSGSWGPLAEELDAE